MYKQNVVFPYNGILFNNTKEWRTNTSYSMNESWKHAKKKKAITNDHVLDDSIYVKSPKVENAYTFQGWKYSKNCIVVIVAQLY